MKQTWENYGKEWVKTHRKQMREAQKRYYWRNREFLCKKNKIWWQNFKKNRPDRKCEICGGVIKGYLNGKINVCSSRCFKKRRSNWLKKKYVTDYEWRKKESERKRLWYLKKKELKQ
jgi:hypothetical protein